MKNRIDGLEKRLVEYSQKIAEQERAQVLSDVAAQVAHDVVAPITTLQKILTASAGNDEQSRQIVLEELDRINGLARKMLRQYRGEADAEASERFGLNSVVSMMAAEAKAMAMGKCEILTSVESESLSAIGIERLHLFFTPDEFRSWRVQNQNTRALFFFDYEFGKGVLETGLDLIERHQCQPSAFLVTGRATEESVKNVCGGTGIHLIDKIDLDKIEFRLEAMPTPIVLIDDVRANRIAWEAEAKLAGRSTQTFASVEEFLLVQEQFERETEIYVDYLFDGVTSGGVDADRLLKAGFMNVFIATALPREKVHAPAGIRGVVGKEFPTERAFAAASC